MRVFFEKIEKNLRTKIGYKKPALKSRQDLTSYYFTYLFPKLLEHKDYSLHGNGRIMEMGDNLHKKTYHAVYVLPLGLLPLTMCSGSAEKK